jgi:hypothetical protein
MQLPLPEPDYTLDLVEGLSELAYARAEREGKLLNDALCDECPDPCLCRAERECCA